MYESIDVLGYKVFKGKLSDINYNQKLLFNTFSPNSYGIAVHNHEFKIALKNTDVLVLDGIGIAAGSILLNGKNIKKIAGQDCFDYFMELANKNKWKVFFLGSSQTTLNKIINRVNQEYPGVKASGYSPPFRSVFCNEDNQRMIENINRVSPDVLFVGMTAPKQEIWAYKHRSLTNARITVTIGNVFDWYAGNSKRPAKIWVNLRLEWLVRIFLRPEIFKRNTKNQLIFVKDLLLALVGVRGTYKNRYN